MGRVLRPVVVGCSQLEWIRQLQAEVLGEDDDVPGNGLASASNTNLD